MSATTECPGCGLAISEHDDTVDVGGRTFHCACAEEGGVPIEPAERRRRRRRFGMLVASRIGAGRSGLGSPAGLPLPPDD